MKELSHYTRDDFMIIYKFWIDSRNHFLKISETKNSISSLNNAGLCNSIAFNIYELMRSFENDED